MARGEGVALFAKLGWVLAFVAFAIVRALWVRLEAPEGRPLSAAEAPRLFARLERIRRRVGAPPLHAVLAMPDVNAAVVQVPRWGILGGERNYLLLGIPLLRALSPTELEAVVAHEFGHLSSAHGRFSGWIYRLRSTWSRLLDAIPFRHRRRIRRIAGEPI